jgi:hypothetical protein
VSRWQSFCSHENCFGFHSERWDTCNGGFAGTKVQRPSLLGFAFECRVPPYRIATSFDIEAQSGHRLIAARIQSVLSGSREAV